MEKDTCPLCDRKPIKVRTLSSSYDTLRFDCPVCGEFGMFDHDAEDIHSHGARWLISCASRTKYAQSRDKLMPVYGIPAGYTPQSGYVAYDFTALGSGSVPSVAVRMERALLNIAAMAPRIAQRVALIWHDDYALLWGEDADAGRYIFVQLQELGLLHPFKLGPKGGTAEILPAGWAKVDDLRRGGGEMAENPTVFVAMSFDSRLAYVYDEGIKPAVEAAGYEPVQLARVEHNNQITDEIVAGIRASRFVVADFTGQRQSVYYEAGFARGIGREVVFLVNKDEVYDLHFDTRQFNHIAWSDTADLALQLEARILATMGRPA